MGERANKPVRAVLGERLRALRKARGLSQEKLGHSSNLSGKFIGEVERREKSISIDSLARCATALDVELRELVDGVPVNGKKARPVTRDEEAFLAFARTHVRKLTGSNGLPVLKALAEKW